MQTALEEDDDEGEDGDALHLAGREQVVCTGYGLGHERGAEEEETCVRNREPIAETHSDQRDEDGRRHREDDDAEVVDLRHDAESTVRAADRGALPRTLPELGLTVFLQASHPGPTPDLDTSAGAMRLPLVLCSIAAAAILAGTSGAGAATGPTAGTLSVENGRGMITVELRGSILGRIAAGTLRVVDLSPRDKYAPKISGRKLTQLRVGPRTVVYRGQGLRFSMLGGSYRFVARGTGIALSGVGWGSVTLLAQPRFVGDDVGVYSVDGVDCSAAPESCTALPEVPLKLKLGTPASEAARTLPSKP